MGFKSNAAIAIDPSLMMVKAGMEPDAWQAKILRQRPKRLLLNCTRQAGKSTVIAAMSLYEALYYGPSLVLLLSPSLRQSQELFRVIMRFRTALGISVDPEAESTMRVEFPGGSRIVALPGKEQNIRGFSSVGLLVIDEASRVPDDLYNSVKPMIAVSGGRLVCLSTPFGKRGFFHKEWTEGTDWERVELKATQCPRISAGFLAQEKAALPDNWFRQEYMCEFADTDDAVFRYEDVQAAVSEDVKPLFGLPKELPENDVQPLVFG